MKIHICLTSKPFPGDSSASERTENHQRKDRHSRYSEASGGRFVLYHSRWMRVQERTLWVNDKKNSYGNWNYPTIGLFTSKRSSFSPELFKLGVSECLGRQLGKLFLSVLSLYNSLNFALNTIHVFASLLFLYFTRLSPPSLCFFPSSGCRCFLLQFPSLGIMERTPLNCLPPIKRWVHVETSK